MPRPPVVRSPAFVAAASALGRRLREEREQRGVTLTTIALHLKRSKSYIHSLETGDLSTWPEVEAIEGYERVLQLGAGTLTALATDLRPVQGGHLGVRTQASVVEVLNEARGGVGSSRASNPLRSPPVPRQIAYPDLANALSLACELIEDAASSSPSPGQRVVATWLGPQDAFSVLQDSATRWQHAVRAALRQGWDFRYLYRPPKDSNGRVAFVRDVLSFLGFAGRFQVYALPQAPNPVAPYDLLITPAGVMVFLATTQTRHSDSALFFLRDSDTSDVATLWEGHANMLLAEAEQAMTIYRRLSRSATDDDNDQSSVQVSEVEDLRFDIALTEAEMREGDRYLVKGGFSTLTVPLSVEESRIIKAENFGIPFNRDAAKTLLDNKRRRVEAFLNQVRKWSFKDIYNEEDLIRFAMYGETSRDDSWQILGPIPPRERLLHIDRVIELLEFENYEIGLVSGEQGTKVTDVFWEIKDAIASSRLFLETWTSECGRTVEIDVEIKDAAVVDSFKYYFMTQWNAIPIDKRTKGYVIPFIEHLKSLVP